MRSVGWGEVSEVGAIGVSEVIEVLTIGVGEMRRTEVTFWIGGDEIRVSEMWFEVTVCTEVTC